MTTIISTTISMTREEAVTLFNRLATDLGYTLSVPASKPISPEIVAAVYDSHYVNAKKTPLNTFPKIHAIKELRTQTGCSLKEAKDAIEAEIGRRAPPVTPVSAPVVTDTFATTETDDLYRALEVVRGDAKQWKEIALYLADCHAATAGYDGQMKSVSKARKDRYRSICEKALGMLKGEISAPPRHVGVREYEENVHERLQFAINECK